MSVAGRLAAFQASAGQLAPDVGGPSPARHSLPGPEFCLRDQPARGRTTGRARAAGWIRASRTHPVMSASLRACGVLSRGGWSSASKTGAKQMSRKDAHAFAASLAATLMVSIVVFQAGDGTFGAVPADEIDGDDAQVIADVDPCA